VSRGIVTTGLAVALGLAPCDGVAQVFLATRPHPEFAIGPLLVVAGVRPDLGPVSVRVSFGLTLPPNGHLEDMQQDLYLLWPAEVADASAAGAPDPVLRAYVEQRGFAVVTEGRLALAVRDRAKLGTPAPSDPLPESAPAQAGVGTLVKDHVDAPPRRPERPSQHLGAPHYRGVRRVPEPRMRLGRLATVRRWDEEHHEVAIELVYDRVSDVETRVRSSRSPAPLSVWAPRSRPRACPRAAIDSDQAPGVTAGSSHEGPFDDPLGI
jgi:hypothetical protein